MLENGREDPKHPIFGYLKPMDILQHILKQNTSAAYKNIAANLQDTLKAGGRIPVRLSTTSFVKKDTKHRGTSSDQTSSGYPRPPLTSSPRTPVISYTFPPNFPTRDTYNSFKMNNSVDVSDSWYPNHHSPKHKEKIGKEKSKDHNHNLNDQQYDEEYLDDYDYDDEENLVEDEPEYLHDM